MWMKVVFHTVHYIQHCFTILCIHTLDAFPKPFQNKNEIDLPSFFSRGSTIKGFTVGTTIHARHPDSLCLLFQATAPPDRPPAPASGLIQTTSLWFPATNCSLRLNLSAFCPSLPQLFQLIYPWVIAVVWTGDQESADGWIRLETEMELNPRVKWSLDANRYKISCLNYVPKLPFSHFLVGGEGESEKPGCTFFF